MDQQRRHLLSLAVSAFGLSVGGPLATAAAAIPSALEDRDTTATALTTAEAAVHAAGLAQMRPDTDPDHVQAQALAAYRDALMIHRTGRAATTARALIVQAFAATMVAERYGYRRHHTLAAPWFERAVIAANQAAELGDVRGPGVGALAEACAARVMLYTAHGSPADAECLAYRAWTRAVADGTHRTRGYNGAALALAPSLVARARATLGNHAGAAEALDHARQWIETPGYRVEVDPAGADGPHGATAPMSALGYGLRAHEFTTAEVVAMAGDTTRSRAAAHSYLTGHDDPPSRISVVTLTIGDAWSQAAAGHVVEGAEYAYAQLGRLPADLCTPPVLHRTGQLIGFVRGRNGHGDPAARAAADRLEGLYHRMLNKSVMSAPV